MRSRHSSELSKDWLNLRPPSKSTISEIITVHKVNGREIETKHTMQMQVQAHIDDFYRQLYDFRECRDSLEDVKQFLQGMEIPQVT